MRRWSMVMMAAAGASYGLVTPIIKLATLHHVPVRLLTAYQFPIALGIFLVAAMSPTAHPRQGVRKEWLVLTLTGIFGATTALCYYHALALVAGSLAIILLFQFTWMLPLVAWIVFGERPSRGQWLAIAAVWAGTLVAAGADRITQVPITGVILGTLAGLSYALTLLCQGQVSLAGSPWMRSLWSTGVSTAVVLAVYRPWAVLTPPTPALLWGSAAGLFGQVLPLLLVYSAAPILGAALTTILAALELPVAVLLSWTWLRESVSWLQWLGVAIILTAVTISSLRTRPPAAVPRNDP